MLTDQKLKDFIIRISSGSTPDTKKSDEHYTDAHNGVSFIRVQNLSPEGLRLDDCKCITFNTHNRLLKRSQVSGGDLLVKITGVGRMAVSSVAPHGFEGNINQHIVVIKAADHQNSEFLAAFLNSDVGEKLSSRRSTGGTRPALDYRALKSIPIIYKPQIVATTESAYAQKRQKEQEAAAILDSIDDYVLAELEIEIPTIEEKKCFVVYAGEVEGRVDPNAYRLLKTSSVDAIKSSKYKSVRLKDIVAFRKEIITDSFELPYVGLENIESNTGFYVPSVEEKESFNSALKFESGDVLFPKLRPYLNKVYFAKLNGICSTEFHVLTSNNLNNLYLFAFLRSKLVVNQTTCLMTGNTLPRLQTQDVQKLLIPLPSFDIQEKIADEVMKRQSEAAKLRQEADAIVEEAQKEVELILLEGVSS